MKFSKKELNERGFKLLELETALSGFMGDKGDCSCSLNENENWQCYLRNGGACRVYAMDMQACRVVLIPEIAFDDEDKIYFRFEHDHDEPCNPDKCHFFALGDLEK